MRFPFTTLQSGEGLMQCHNCQYNGKGSEICLSCGSANYLDNDFKTITPVGDIQNVQKSIDPVYFHERKSEQLIKFSEEKTSKNLEDCENVLRELKKCHHSSFKHIAFMVALFVSVGIHTPLLVSVLDGESFSDYARENGVSKQSVQQLWNRLTRNNKLLQDIKKRNTKHGVKNKKKKRSEEEEEQKSDEIS